MMRNNSEFDGLDIPDRNIRSLIAAIIYDVILSFAKQITRERRGQQFDEREKNDCERFLLGNDYRIYADMIELNISGKEIYQMIKRNPKKYYKNDRLSRVKVGPDKEENAVAVCG